MMKEKLAVMNQSPALRSNPVFLLCVPSLTLGQATSIIDLLKKGPDMPDIEMGEEATLEQYICKHAMVPLNPRHYKDGLRPYSIQLSAILGEDILPYTNAGYTNDLKVQYQTGLLKLPTVEEMIQQENLDIPPVMVCFTAKRVAWFVQASMVGWPISLSSRYNLQSVYGRLLNQDMRDPVLYSLAMDMLEEQDAILVDMPLIGSSVAAPEMAQLQKELQFELTPTAYQRVCKIWDNFTRRNAALGTLQATGKQSDGWSITIVNGQAPEGNPKQSAEDAITNAAYAVLRSCTGDYAARIWDRISKAVFAELMQPGKNGFTSDDVQQAVGKALAASLGINV